MSRTIVKTVNCTSYNEEDGCIEDTYTFEIKINTGYVYIRHEISCGLAGRQLFCAPPIITNYGTPIPEYIVQMIDMVLVNDDFKMESRHKAASIDKFIIWLDDSMKEISKEKRETEKRIERLEQETEEQFQENKKFMETNINLLSGLLQKN
jgi:hypothetical protein